MSEREPQSGAQVRVDAVEWLPTGAETGLLRVRGAMAAAERRPSWPPALVIVRDGAEHRRASLPEPPGVAGATWRGAYVVAAGLLSPPPDALWVEWEEGLRVDVPVPAGIAPPPADPGEEPGGEVVDRAVLAERRARRAEAAEREQSRVAREALEAVEALERRGRELEEQLEHVLRDRDVLQERVTGMEQQPPAPLEDPLIAQRLAAALDAVARQRAEAVRLRLALRVSETERAAAVVRLAGSGDARERLAELSDRLGRAEALAAERSAELVALHADLESVRLAAAAGDVALAEAHERIAALEGEVAGARERLRREGEARAAAVERTVALAAAARAESPAEPAPAAAAQRPPVPAGLADRAQALAAAAGPVPPDRTRVAADLEAAARRLRGPAPPAATAPLAPLRPRPRRGALARLERWLRRHMTSG